MGARYWQSTADELSAETPKSSRTLFGSLLPTLLFLASITLGFTALAQQSTTYLDVAPPSVGGTNYYTFVLYRADKNSGWKIPPAPDMEGNVPAGDYLWQIVIDPAPANLKHLPKRWLTVRALVNIGIIQGGYRDVTSRTDLDEGSVSGRKLRAPFSEQAGAWSVSEKYWSDYRQELLGEFFKHAKGLMTTPGNNGSAEFPRVSDMDLLRVLNGSEWRVPLEGAQLTRLHRIPVAPPPDKEQIRALWAFWNPAEVDSGLDLADLIAQASQSSANGFIFTSYMGKPSEEHSAFSKFFLEWVASWSNTPVTSLQFPKEQIANEYPQSTKIEKVPSVVPSEAPSSWRLVLINASIAIVVLVVTIGAYLGWKLLKRKRFSPIDHYRSADRQPKNDANLSQTQETLREPSTEQTRIAHATFVLEKRFAKIESECVRLKTESTAEFAAQLRKVELRTEKRLNELGDELADFKSGVRLLHQASRKQNPFEEQLRSFGDRISVVESGLSRAAESLSKLSDQAGSWQAAITPLAERLDSMARTQEQFHRRYQDTLGHKAAADKSVFELRGRIEQLEGSAGVQSSWQEELTTWRRQLAALQGQVDQLTNQLADIGARPQAGVPEAEALRRILAEGNCLDQDRWEDLWAGGPDLVELATRLLTLYPPLARAEPATLQAIGSWLEAVSKGSVELVGVSANEPYNSAYHSAIRYDVSKGRVNRVISVLRPGLRVGDSVRLKAQVVVST